MDELLVIIGAELILLVSIAAMVIHNRMADVLNRRFPDEADGVVPERTALEQARRRRIELKKPGPKARPLPEKTKKSTPGQQSSRQPRPMARAEVVDFVHSSQEKRAAHLSLDGRQTCVRGHQAPSSLPRGVRIYAIGDIHGCSDLLSRLLRSVEIDCQQRPVERALTVFVGDYIDRGPRSRDVIDLLLRWRENHDTVFLRGNHETFLPRFLSDSKTLDEWRKCGGLETLLSYGLQPSISPDRYEQERLADQLASSLPKEHFDFLESLEPFYSCGDFFFVHAGIRPGIPIDEQSEEDLLWIREEFLASEEPFERFIVHGHTPVEMLDLRPNRVNIDTGAFATGCLTCVVIEGSGITQLPAVVEPSALSAP